MHPIHPSALQRRFARAVFVGSAAFTLIACGDQAIPTLGGGKARDARSEDRPAAVGMAAPLAARAAMKAAQGVATGATVDETSSSGPTDQQRNDIGDASTATPASEAEIRPGTMLVRTAAVTIRVDSLERAIARARALAREVGGVVGGVEVNTGEQSQRSASLELRVPSARFDDALTGVSPLGTVEHSTSGAEDVGEEFVDMGARITNGHRIEARLINLLATRTGKLSDVLMLERELARVRGEIERAEGRRRYLGRRAAMSTITLALHEPLPLLVRDPGAHPLGDAVLTMWRNFMGLVAFGVASLGYVVPLVIVLLLGVRVRRGLRRPAAVTAPARAEAGA